MEIILTAEENAAFELLVNSRFSNEIAIAHIMQVSDVEFFVEDSGEEAEEIEEEE